MVVVHGVGQIAPDAGHARHLCLASEPSLTADLAGDPGDLVGEGGQLVDHRVDGLLQLEDLAAGGHVDLLREVALGHRSGHLGDVADLGGQIARHGVDRVGQVGPGARDARHLRLPAERSLGTDLAGDPGDFGGEHGQLVDHAVEDLGDVAHEAVRVVRQPGTEVPVAYGCQAGQQPSQLLVARHRIDDPSAVAGHAHPRSAPQEPSEAEDSEPPGPRCGPVVVHVFPRSRMWTWCGNTPQVNPRFKPSTKQEPPTSAEQRCRITSPFPQPVTLSRGTGEAASPPLPCGGRLRTRRHHPARRASPGCRRPR